VEVVVIGCHFVCLCFQIFFCFLLFICMQVFLCFPFFVHAQLHIFIMVEIVESSLAKVDNMMFPSHEFNFDAFHIIDIQYWPLRRKLRLPS
jgi:hypothetical protein